MNVQFRKYVGNRNGQKEFYIELIRVIAIILVIFNHTDGFFLYYSNTDNSLTWWFSFLGSALCRINVPLFVMITGALLLDKKESVAHLFKRRILRIGIALTAFSLFYYTLDVIRGREEGFAVLKFVKGLLSGSIQESFWYLYLYLGLLLMLPLLRKLAVSCDNSELRYLLGLQLVMGTGAGVFSFLTGIEINQNLYVLNIYVFYLLTGYYLGRRIDMSRFPSYRGIAAFAVNLLCLAGTYFFVRLDYLRQGAYSQDVLNLLTPVLTIGIFFNIRWFSQRYLFPPKLEKVVFEAGSCVFGIYLLEHFARIQLLPLYLYLSEYTFGVLACSCYVITAFILSWFYTELLKHIPGVKKLL